MRNRPVVCCLVVLSTFLATIASLARIENDRKFIQFGAGICLFGLFFVIKNFTAASIIRAAFIGIVYSCSWEIPDPLDSFIIIVSIFHLGEYIAVALSNPAQLKYDSFLLNHSTAYHAAMVAAIIEFSALHALFGTSYVILFLSNFGFYLALFGDFIRKLSMVWCGPGFTHLIQYHRRSEHKLVTTGPYSLCRHPSYFGWGLSSIASQVCLCNPVCIILYTCATYSFFADRIPHEEQTLRFLFGREYDDYRKKVPFSGIPFLDLDHCNYD